MDGFKKFLLRGNVVDLAVGVLIGAGFSAVVNAFVTDLLTPFIGLIGGQPDFSDWVFRLNGTQFNIGHFLNQSLSFIITALVVYFGVVTPMNTFIEHIKREAPKDPTTKHCPHCLSDIPIKATRCKFCTSTLTQKS